jgi:glycosyltransferase involved in cell wall biosynthesis
MRAIIAPPPPDGLEAGPVPSFSVVIRAYQAAAVVGDAVRSALDQTVPAAEVVVCDDGSTDDIEGALEPFHDRIVLVRKENGGAASALNAAVQAATEEFVSILDADDAYEPERLEALGELAARRPDLDILMTDCQLEVDGKAVGRFSTETPFAADSQDLEILNRCYIAAPAIRRRRVQEQGGFDESLATGSDWDFWIRALLGGARAGLVDAPLYRYRVREDSVSGPRRESMRARVTVLEKVARDMKLTSKQADALGIALTRNRKRALLTEAEHALRSGAPDKRRRAWRVAAGPGFGPITRLKAAAAALAPRRAARRLEEGESREGSSRLLRSGRRG